MREIWRWINFPLRINSGNDVSGKKIKESGILEMKGIKHTDKKINGWKEGFYSSRVLSSYVLFLSPLLELHLYEKLRSPKLVFSHEIRAPSTRIFHDTPYLRALAWICVCVGVNTVNELSRRKVVAKVEKCFLERVKIIQTDKKISFSE